LLSRFLSVFFCRSFFCLWSTDSPPQERSEFTRRHDFGLSLLSFCLILTMSK
jgi:hypothetical protein